MRLGLEGRGELAGVISIVVQAHAEVGQLGMVAIGVVPQVVQEVLQLREGKGQC